MDGVTIIAVVSILTAGFTIAIGVIGPSLGEGKAVATALTSLAQQPDASSTITRTLFVGLAMIDPGEPVTSAYLQQGDWQIEIAGELYPCRCSLKPLYDPEMSRIRS